MRLKVAISKFIFLCPTFIFPAFCQTPSPQVQIAGRSSTPFLPQYVVYHQFLHWVAQLDKQTAASSAADTYKFAKPFSRANLQPQHLDLIRLDAHQLDADMHKHDALARSVIDRYRKAAQMDLAQGKPLPPVPSEIWQLERERTAILVQHYAALRSALGLTATAQLDEYITHEFAPHIKLKRLQPPTQPGAQ